MERGWLLWVLLLGLGLALIVLVTHHDQGHVAGLATDDFASLTVQAALVVFIGSAALVLFRRRFLEALQAAAFWVVLALLLAVGYTYRLELRDVADRVMAELLPGRAAVSRGATPTAAFARGRSGEFRVTAEVNDVRIPLVLDTGASSVVLTHEAAQAVGLPVEVLAYTVTVDTANGATRAAPVTLDRLAVGAIIERSVPALVAQPGQLRISLLGMTFLSRLESWQVRGDQLLMRGYP